MQNTELSKVKHTGGGNTNAPLGNTTHPLMGILKADRLQTQCRPEVENTLKNLQPTSTPKLGVRLCFFVFF